MLYSFLFIAQRIRSVRPSVSEIFNVEVLCQSLHCNIRLMHKIEQLLSLKIPPHLKKVEHHTYLSNLTSLDIVAKFRPGHRRLAVDIKYRGIKNSSFWNGIFWNIITTDTNIKSYGAIANDLEWILKVVLAIGNQYRANIFSNTAYRIVLLPMTLSVFEGRFLVANSYKSNKHTV